LIILNRELKKSLSKLKTLYALLERQTEKFKKISGLECIQGCGICCEKDEIEASVLEFLPLAIELWKNGEALIYLEILLYLPEDSRCVFYRKNEETNIGGCGCYPYRGMICRLFGFSALPDKNGKLRLVTCNAIKSANPDKTAKAQDLIDNGFPVPVMSSFANELVNINPALGFARYPLNQAIRLAIEYIGFIIELNGKYKPDMGK